MPPAPPVPEPQNSSEDYPTLTNDDVAILCRIITAAEQDPNVDTLPFRAIFTAYDQVLAQDGLNPDHDQVYLRFLFRLGDNKRPGLSLYNNFEALLEELGIKIEFGSDDVQSQEGTRSPSEEDWSEAHNADELRLLASNDIKTRSRRASFSSSYITQDANTRRGPPRPRSRSSMSRLQSREPTMELPRPSTRATTRPTERTQAKPSQDPAQATRNRLTAREFASNLKHYQRRHSSKQRLASQPTNIEVVTANSERSARRYESLPVDDASTSPDPQQLGSSHQARPPYIVEPPALLYRPSETQLARDIETFQYYRIQQVARTVLEKWYGLAIPARERRGCMEQQATKHDISTLLRGGFDQWRVRFRRKRRAAEVERFFEYQERKVNEDRGLYLLRKAFTHWAECCRETGIRNHQARRHFLEIKYFTAWLHLTTVNSQKVDRQQLAKAFKLWRQSVAQTSTFSMRAILLRNHRTARAAYWCWFWAFCEARAPGWKDNRMKKGFFLIWATKQEQLVEWEQRTGGEQKLSIARKRLSVWLLKFRASLANSRTATVFRRTNVITQAFQVWKRRTSHAPLIRQVSNIVDWRVAGTTFATVIARYRTERQANVVSQSRVVRNSWTAWNDGLRQQILIKQIDDRVVIEALYRWVVQERHILLARLHRQRRLERALSSLTLCWSNRRAHRDGAQRNVEATVARRSLTSVMKHWRSRMEYHDTKRRLAFEFHSPRITQEVMRSWTTQHVYQQKLHDWARYAESYLLAHKLVLKRWHDAMIESKRQKRRNAYARMRRTVKMHLAASVLHRWRHMAAHNRDQMEEARSLHQDRLLHFGTGIFDKWRMQTDTRVTRSDEAELHYRVNLCLHLLHVWSDQTRKQWRMADIASLNDDMRIHDISKHWLRKLRLRMIRVTGGPEALAWFVKVNQRRRLQNLFRHWQGKTTSIVPRPPPGSALPSRVRQPNLLHAAHRSEYVMDRTAESIALDRVFDLGESTLGFPSTPSKAKARAEKAVALVEASTTPAGTPLRPLGTPFPLRWQAQRVTGTGSVRRSALAKSTMFRDSIFASIREGSPSTPSRG